MTRHRRNDEDGLDGDAPWHAQDYDRPDAAGDYPPPWGGPAGAPRPARGALGTSSGRDDRPGDETGPPWERTSPPWELPGWDEAASAQRGPREDGAHPSGPLPQVSSGGYARSEYPSRGAGAGGSGYPGPDPRYDDTGYHDGFPSHSSRARDDHERGYPGESGYSTGSGYPGEPGYPGEGYRDGGDYPGGDYPAGPGYAPEGYARDDYPGQSGYPGEPGYPDGPDEGYPGQDDTGYQVADDYPPAHDEAHSPHDQYGRSLRDDPDDHQYGDTGGWYSDGDEDQGWAEDEYDSGLLGGFSEDADYRRAPDRGGAAEQPRSGRGGPDRPRGAKPKRKSAMRRAAGWLALTVLVIILVVAGGGFYYFWHNYLHPPDYSGPGTGSVKVQITSGETATQVGQQLVNLGVVASVRAFSNAAKASGHGSSLQPGYYLLHKHMAATLAFALLLKPSSRIQLTVVIPEGLRLSEVIATLGKATGDLKGYQQAIKNVSALGLPSYAKGNPEGYLFPATYTIQYGTPPIQVLHAMVQRFDQEAQADNLPAVAAHDQISKSDAIIVASLVQAEGKRPQDLAKIARVIYNRLNAKMNLQLDTTVLYALGSRAGDVTVPQTRNTKSRYNTYLHVGLPPGPIDSPGHAAIQAALHPTPGHHDWLYFLTVNPKTGLTKFTGSYVVFQTYEQQLNNYMATHH